MYKLLCSQLGTKCFLRTILVKHVYKQSLPRKHWHSLQNSSHHIVEKSCNKLFRVGLFNLSLPYCSMKHKLLSAHVGDSEVETASKGKLFEENESELHHKVLENINAYSSTIFHLDPYFNEKYRFSAEDYLHFISIKDWESKSIHSLAINLISLGIYSSKLNVTIDDNRFDYLVSAFVSKRFEISDDDLVDCLIAIQIWPQSDHVKAPNFLRIWKSLDDVCSQRSREWTIDRVLYMMDLWYNIRLIRLSDFVYKGLAKISNKCKDLTAAQMIQTLFYMSCVRKLHPAISLREYEYYFQRHITHLTTEEIAIFSLGFFKTKSKIINTKILLYMMQRIAEEIDTISPITLVAFSKCLRFSHKPDIGFTANDLVSQLAEKRMDSLSLINAIHITHISTQVQFYNEEVLTKLAEKFYNNPSEARLKDMERMVFFLSMFNFIPPSTPDILEVIVQQLDRPIHIQSGKDHPLALLSLIYYLSLLRTYPEKQIRHLLSEEHLNKYYQKRYNIDVQILQIDYNRALEGPPGSEYLLTQTIREYLGKRYSIFIPDKRSTFHNQYDKLMLEVMDVTNQVLGGEQYSLVAYPLPHFHRADIIFHLDDNGNPVAIPEEMRSITHFSDVVRAPEPQGWYCAVVGGRNMYMHNVPKMVGEQITKLRQLRLLGYTPIVIPTHYWKGEKDKAEYLKLKYFTRTG